jgi:hypothetical protein
MADILLQHLTLELECIERLYPKVYLPELQRERNVYCYLRARHGASALSSRYFQSMTQVFVYGIEAFARRAQVPLLTFAKDTRREELAAQERSRFPGTEGILFIGNAQEKVRIFRT